MDRWKDYIERIRRAYTTEPKYPMPAIPMTVEYMDDMVVVWAKVNGGSHVVQVYVEESEDD